MATIDPSMWIAAQTYPITIMGTGYTTPANATSNCFATQIAVGVNTGSLTLSDVTVVDSTKITGKRMVWAVLVGGGVSMNWVGN